MTRARTPWIAAALGAAAGALLFTALKGGRSLRGKVVLITGGSRGLGLELARVCLDKGARVALLGRDADSLARAAEQLEGEDGVHTIACDVSRPDDVRAAVAAIGERLGDVDA